MLDKSRQVHCPTCHEENYWQGQPQPSDEMYCQRCGTFITTYDGFIEERIRRDVTRTMVQRIDPGSDEQLSILEDAFRNTPHS